MTRTDERYQSNPAIMAIARLELHRETLMELTEDTEGRDHRWGSNTGSGMTGKTCRTNPKQGCTACGCYY